MGSQGLYEGQKFDVTHQACRLIALDDISVIRPKNFRPVAHKMRRGTLCPPPRPNRVKVVYIYFHFDLFE